MAQQDSGLKVGARLGIYEITEVLRADPFSIFYYALNHQFDTLETIQEYFPSDLAIRAKDGRTVKPVSETAIQSYKKGLTRFLEQGEILFHIKHHSIARIRNTLRFNGTGYTITEFIDGVPLSRLYDSAIPFADAEVKSILLALLCALGKVHGQNLLHGNVHPDNILITADGNPVLANFASFQDSPVLVATRPSQSSLPGHPAPGHEDSGALPRASDDLYALGATIYRCIMLTDPVAASDRVSALTSGKPDPLIPVSELKNLHGDKKLRATIDWMLSLEKHKQPRSAAQIIATLKEDQTNQELPFYPRPVNPGDTALPASNASFFPAPSGMLIGGLIGACALFIIVGLGFLGPKQESTMDLPNPENEILEIVMEDDSDKESDNVLFNPTEVVEFAPVEMVSDPPIELGNDRPDEVETDFELELSERALTFAESVAPAAKAVRQSSPDNQREMAINNHLITARKNLEGLNLTTPVGHSALDNFNAVLAIDVDNSEAKKGIERIFNTYIWLIGQDLKKGRVLQAQLYFDRALSISPNAPILTQTRANLTKAWQKKIGQSKQKRIDPRR